MAQETRVAKRYAKSLFLAAKEASVLDKTYQDLLLVKTTLNEQRPLKVVIGSPVVKSRQKKNIAAGVFQAHISELSLHFLYLVIDKKRGELMTAILDAFIGIYEKSLGILNVKLITAVELPKAFTENVSQILMDKGYAKKVVLSGSIDPSILGGFVLRYEDKLLDASVKTKLKEIKQSFLN